VLRPGRAPALDLRSFAAQQLATCNRPEALVLADELPRTATEKVAKDVLRDGLDGSGASVERMW